VSKLHRRDTPHHLKNKRVQQHLNDKAANVILSKLKEHPIPTVEEIQHAEMNPVPLSQDIGLPIVDHIVDVNQNGIEISPNVIGEFAYLFYLIVFCYFLRYDKELLKGLFFNNLYTTMIVKNVFLFTILVNDKRSTCIFHFFTRECE
jgi:hypothetical protein